MDCKIATNITALNEIGTKLVHDFGSLYNSVGLFVLAQLLLMTVATAHSESFRGTSFGD